MKRRYNYKIALSLLLAAGLLFSLLLPALAAVTPGPKAGRENAAEEAELRRYRELAAGFSFDRVLAQIYIEGRPDPLPIAADPLVRGVERLMLIEENEEGRALEICVVNLRADSAEEVLAFIEKYKNEPYLCSLEPDGFGMIPEYTEAVIVELRFLSDYLAAADPRECLAAIPAQFLPADFGEALVKSVYVQSAASVTPSKEEFAVLEALGEEGKAAVRSDIPLRLVLEMQENDPMKTAAFALELIDYENSALFTEAQKANFRKWIAGVLLAPYDFCSDGGFGDFVNRRVFRIWMRGGVQSPADALTAAGIETTPENFVVLLRTEECAVCYLTVSAAEYDIGLLGEKLRGIGEILEFACLTAHEADAAINADLQSAALLAEAVSGPGDINGDGKVSAADARLALRAAVKLRALNGSAAAAADADGSGFISAADARLILRAAVGLTPVKDLRLCTAAGQSVLLGPLRDRGTYQWKAELVPDDTYPQSNAGGITVTEAQADICPPVPGNTPLRFFSVTGNRPGKYIVRCTLWCPWENAVLETFEVRIIIT